MNQTTIASLVCLLSVLFTQWGLAQEVPGQQSSEQSAVPLASVFAGVGEPRLGNPFGIETMVHADGGETVWITTIDDHSVYRAEWPGGRLQRIAGSGVKGYAGDGGPAIQAKFNWPHEVRVDQQGNLFIADTRNHVIRRVDGKTGLISTLAGSGKEGFAGDGESGARVQFRQPHSVALDGDGGLLVADTVNHRLRRIDLKTGITTTISGDGQRRLPVDGSDASTCSLFGPRAIAVEKDSIWIALREGNSIWRIDRAAGTIHHVAGTGKKGYTGDGGDPKLATFSGPKGLAIDDRQRLLVVDTENHSLRRIDLSSNIVETVLGGPQKVAAMEMKRPHGISFSNNVGTLIADSEHHRVLRLPISD